MKRTIEWIALFSLVALADCGGGDGAGNSSCRGNLKKYEDCGVFQGGVASCHTQPERRFDECFAGCVNAASCADIADYVCDDDPNACMENCFEAEFVCPNGTSVNLLKECDGANDCGDGSDEHGCELPIFRCGPQYEEVPGSYVCDGEFDCSTGTDETECGEYICFEEAASVVSEESPSENPESPQAQESPSDE